MAQGWDVASVSDAPLGSVAPTIPAAGAAGWDVASEAPAKTPRYVDHTSFVQSAKRVANAALDAAGGALAMVPTAVTGIASDVLGQDQATHDAAKKAVHDFIAGPENPDLAAAGATFKQTDVGKGVTSLAHSGDQALRGVVGDQGANAVERVAGDVAPVLPLAGGAARAVGEATGVAKPIVAPLAEGAVSQARSPADVLSAAGYRINPSTQARLALSGAGERPSNLALAGEKVSSTAENTAANQAHNLPINNGWAATDIGLPRETPLSPENIAKAEEAPAATYDRVRGALSDAQPVSPETAAALAKTNAPDVLGRTLPAEHGNSIALMSQEPMTGGDLMDRISALRQEGYKRTTAAPGGQIDPAVEAYGNAQLDAANALETELNNRVNATNPKLAGDYQAARKLFAKINTVKRSMNGYNIDPSKVAKAAAKTDAIDGGLGIIADAYTHAPREVSTNVPATAAFGDSAAIAGSSGAAGGVVAAGFGHPTTAALLTALPVVQHGIRKALGATRGETAAADLDATANGPLGAYFGGNATPTPTKLFALQPPPGEAFAPHQPSVLRTGENVPVAEQGGLPPTLNLAHPPGTAFEPNQPGVLRTGETIPAAESTQTPQPSVRLTPPPGQAFEAHPPQATSSRVQGQPPTAPQYELPLGDRVSAGGTPPEPMIDVYHGGPRAFDEFSHEHMGTGEGNQNFGHGTYVGTARGVGEHYVPEQGGFLTHGRVPQRVADNALDLDAPIKDQPAVLKALGVDPNAPVKLNGINPEWTGRELHDALIAGETNVGPRIGNSAAESAPKVAKWLLSKGVTGTKYLDQVSRKAGAGTQNYVVFDPKEISVVSHEKLGDRIAGKTTTGGELSADDLKLAE